MSGERVGPSPSPRTSPKTPGEPSPYQTGLRGGGDNQMVNGTIEGTGISQSNGETGQQFLPLRSLGVHTILNPSENQPSMMRGRTEESASSPRTCSTPSNSSPRVAPYAAYQGLRHGQTTPTIDDQHSTAPSSVERGSPGTVRPYPPLAAARRILTPRSPRLISPVQTYPLRALNPPQSHMQHLPAGSIDASRTMPSDAGIPGRSEQSFHARGSPLGPQLSRVASPVIRPPLHMAPPPASTRTLSQPIPGHPNPNAQQARPFFPGGPSVQPGQSPGYPPYTATPMPQAHSGYSAPREDHRWQGGNEHTMQYAPTSVRNFAFGEGQAALRIQPAHGEAFIVPVDTHQGSRQADEKRQRNAGASQRFRKRKKDRETQERMEHQRMESQYRELESRIQSLEHELERVRSDRDRLRDIVYRTPAVSDLAYQGSPSPDSSNTSGPSPLAPRATYGSADPETGERSSQRRRTDPHPHVEYSSTPYTSAPGSLPPINTSVYPTSASHPGTPSSMSQAPQLPPLRLSTTSGAPSTTASGSNTPVQAYQHLKREPFETGWAAPPRDPSQR